MSKVKYAVGVDLGGTSIKIGLVNKEGKIVKKISVDSNAHNGPDEVVSQIKKGIKLLLKNTKDKIERIGIGSPGTVDSKKGTVENPPKFPGWEKVYLAKSIKKEFDSECYVENDANAAAIGELIYGAGKKFNNFIMITLGTGVGSGIIIDKKIYGGETGGAGEIGHTTIDHNGAECKCGSKGCIEAYVGNNYIIKRVKEELPLNADSLINRLIENDMSPLTPKIIHEAALQNDTYAISFIVDIGTKIGHGLANAVNTLDITNLIIGGGVAGFGEILFNAIREATIDRVMIPFKPRVKVKPAKLKNDAGIKGASALVFYKS